MNVTWRRVSAAGIVALLALVVGCGEDLTETGPQIESMTIDPSTITTSDQGMTDEFFTVQVQISGFTEPIDLDSSEVFYIDSTGMEVSGNTMAADKTIQGATADNVCPDVCTITFSRIFLNWFAGTPASETPYEIGAEIVSEPGDTGRASERAKEVGLAQVTVTEG